MTQRAIRAKLRTPPHSGLTKNGKAFVSFDLEAKRGLLPCTVWDHMVGECDVEALRQAKVGDWIVVRGFEGEEGECIVKWFEVEGAEKEKLEKSEKERIFDYYRGKRRFVDLQQELIREMEDKGYVPVPWGNGFRFWKKADTRKLNGRHVTDIDFLMDVLGTKRVNEEFSKLFPHGFAISKFPVDKYRALKSRLLDEAERVNRMGLRGI